MLHKSGWRRVLAGILALAALALFYGNWSADSTLATEARIAGWGLRRWRACRGPREQSTSS